MSEKDDRLKYAQDFAHAALRGLTVINGGAIVALFTFIGNTSAAFDHDAIWVAFLCFTGGLTATIAAMICGYFAHGSSWQGRDVAANRIENVGLGLTVAALTLFVAGGANAIGGVLVERPAHIEAQPAKALPPR